MRRPLLSTTGSALLLAIVAGCASSRSAALKPEDSADPTRLVAAGLPPSLRVTPAFTPVMRAALEQSASPLSQAALLPAPPGMPEQLATPLAEDTEESRRARTSLAALLVELVPAPSDEPAQHGTANPEALRRYIAGRQKLLSGNPREALDDLRAAVELDDSAGEPLRELGEAQLALGQRADALQSFRQAQERGLAEPRLLELLGRDALERGDAQQAAVYFARSLKAGAEAADPLLGPVVYVQLAKALAQDGRFSAAREAIAKAFDGAGQVTSTTRYSAEFGAIYRRQGELWREAGDLDLRLGNYTGALESYARSSVLPVMDGVDIAPRLVFAACKSGRPAAAAIYMLEGLAARSGRITAAHAALLAHIAQNKGMGALIAGAISGYRESLQESANGALAPTTSRALARLEAALLPADEARRRLRAHLAADPTDAEAMLALVNTHADKNSAIREVARLAETQSIIAPLMAQALLRSRHDIRTQEFLVQRGDGALLIAASAAWARGNPAEALQLLDGLSRQGAQIAGTLLLKAQLSIAAGRPEIARECAARLATEGSAEARAARARILNALQNTTAARGVLEPVLTDPSRTASQRLADLAFAAELDMQLQDFDAAERKLRRALEIDPGADGVYAGLLEIYGTLRPDQAKGAELVRTLRQELPDGRTMRVLRAREFLRRGMNDAAEREALALANEDPSDPGAIRLLITVWEQDFGTQPDSADKARQWVNERLARHGNAPAYLLALAAIDMGAKTPGVAEPRLRQALAETGNPEISRIFERLLREGLGKHQEADRLTLARLDGRERTPAESFELAHFYASKDEHLKAINAIRDAVEATDTLLPDQERTAASIGAALGMKAAQANQRDSEAVALWLLKQLASRETQLTPDEHEVLLVLLARDSSADVQQLLEAAQNLARQHPSLAGAGYARLSQALVASERKQDALQLLQLAVEQPEAPAPDLLLEWFRVIAIAGDITHLRDLIEQADRTGQSPSLLRRILPDGDPNPASPGAELAYVMGNFMASVSRDQHAEHAYELTLELNPAHPWAANNLGYSLTEQNRDLERAAELLEQAHAALPAEASITDSLGWLRYKQGILHDQEIDGKQRKGAVTLLREAAATEYGSQNPTILDHLGDALWLAGNRAEAIHYWQLAQNWAGRILRAARGDGGQSGISESLAAEYRDIVARTGLKRTTAGTGEWVPVAAQANNPRPAPPPSHAPDEAAAPAQAGPAVQDEQPVN